MHHINGNSKISINIKVNHYSLKCLTNRLTIDERNKILGCVSRKSDRERNKINSKPCCFESERELPLACSGLRPAQYFLSAYSGQLIELARQAET